MQAPDQVLTVAQMRAAENALMAQGETVDTLMARAGRGAAEWVWRVSGGGAVTVLCGPGNNGGDGWVIAETLRARGAAVQVIAPLEPATDAARNARAGYRGEVREDGRGEVLVDCLFGSGLTRPLGEGLAGLLRDLAARHRCLVAVDLPSGVEADSGRPLDEGLPRYDLTLALGAWKLAHWLIPAMADMGERRLVRIGIEPVAGAATLLARPRLSAPAIDAHKYTRGLVLVVAGGMPGAAVLACEGSMRAGAGAVRLAADELHPAALPDTVLREEPVAELLADERLGAVLVGPGLGRDDRARRRLTEVLAARRPTVLDADALHLVGPDELARFAAPLVLTPHEGELAQLAKAFSISEPDKLGLAGALARATGAVVIAKGPDTVIAAPDGRTTLAPSTTSWLSVAGTGDVLAGIVASRLAAGSEPFAAACEGNWLHGEAARRCGAAFLGSDLARAVSGAYAACL
jgi:hydroxyethylthiazole kinase-like uncharacterized protein yjeF